MPTNRQARDKSPRADDAVLGGEAPPLVGGVVLGGIEGVKRRLVTAAVEQRLAALYDAIDYGEAGLDLMLQALQNTSPKVQSAAYFLLKDSDSPKVKHYLSNYLPWFEFDVVKVDAQGVINNRYTKQAQFFAEDLGNGVTLEMVKIPSGTFLMGSPEKEEGSIGYERPQHSVTVKSFFMGKYPVTQAQWQAVAALPPVSTELEPNSSYFKGASRPVEQVSWFDAVEFCARLCQKTGRQYRLPSEAEWEYACRAGTTTPFHFGDTITTDLANYRGTDWDMYETNGDIDASDWDFYDLFYKGSYGQGSLGIFRWETTPVGSFGVANDFGLYDMHGNVTEWCADCWRTNYRGAPKDGSAWKSDKYKDLQLLRGGSWIFNPEGCRSAWRGYNSPGYLCDNYDNGFRVVCEVAWTL